MPRREKLIVVPCDIAAMNRDCCGAPWRSRAVTELNRVAQFPDPATVFNTVSDSDCPGPEQGYQVMRSSVRGLRHCRGP